MENGRPHVYPGQYLEGEHHTFHEIRVARNQLRAAHETLRKQPVHDHAAEDHDSQAAIAISAEPVVTPAGLKDHGEDKRINDQEEYGIEERPRQPDKRALVTRDNIATRHTGYEGAVAD